MTTVEYLLNKLPYNLKKIKNVKCPCCGKNTNLFAHYQLQLEIMPNENGLRYKVYYKLANWCTRGGFDEHIGVFGGMGHSNIKTAIKELLQFKREIRE